MKILLTGATGFIGRHILAAFGDHEIHAVTRSLESVPDDLKQNKQIIWHEMALNETDKLRVRIREIVPERCIHLAWDTKPGRYLDDKSGNLELLQNGLQLLNILIESECQQVIMLGSCAEYAMQSARLQTNSPLDPQTIYAAAKASLALLGPQLCKGSKTRFCWARLFYLYGPGEHHQRLVSGLLAKLMAGEEFACGRGEKKKDYLYIRDVVSGIRSLLTANAEGVYNLCSSEPVTIADIGAAAEKAVGCQGLIRYGAVPERAWDPEFIVGDNSGLKALGWSPAFDLQKGLEDYVRTLGGKP